MSKIVKAALALGAIAVVAGCSLSDPQPEEVVVTAPAPVTAEPVSGKF